MRKHLLSTLLPFMAGALTAQPIIEWQRCYGGSSMEYGEDIIACSSGGYVLVGPSASSDGDVTANAGWPDFWFVRIDPSGGVLWQQSFGGSAEDKPRSVVETMDGGFVMAGHAFSLNGDVSGNSGFDDFWAVKLDSEGGFQWQRCIGGADTDYAWQVIEDPDGALLLVGSVLPDSSVRKAGVVKLDADGELLWQRAIGGPGVESGFSIAHSADGGYFLSGSSNSHNEPLWGWYYGLPDFWLVKLDNSGEMQWEKHFGGSDRDEAYGVSGTADGGCILTGYTKSSDGDVEGFHGGADDIWVVKCDSAGNLEWSRTIGGSGSELAWSVQELPDGAYYVGGSTTSDDGDLPPTEGFDLALIRLSQNGDVEWTKCVGGSSDDYAKTFRPTLDGGVIMCGTTLSDDGDVNGNHGGTDIWVVKLAFDQVSVPEQPGAFTFTLAPNPTQDDLRITWSSPTAASLTVHDALGQVVHSQTVSAAIGQLSLPVAAWASGIYTISLQDATGRQSERFVKE